MKNSFPLVAFICVFFLIPATSIFSQGSLTPPAAPTPTMKSLDQIEPRTLISSAPYTINNYGSYYLSKNLNVASGNAITIATTGVTLDLNGFTISSAASPTNGSGILISTNVQDVTIRNGHIIGGVTYNGSSFATGPGFIHGISSSSNPYNVRVSNVTVAGCSGFGITLGTDYSNVIDHCDVHTVGQDGIHGGVAENCTANQCGGNGINSIVASNCYGTAVTSGHGVYTYNATNCQGVSVSGDGVNSLTATSCYGVSTSGSGIESRVTGGSYGTSTSGSGIIGESASNCEGQSASNYALIVTEANTCQGISFGSGGGILAYLATNSLGESNGATGLDGLNAQYLAVGCYGYSSHGVGLRTNIANSCMGEGATPVVIAHKYNMP